MLSLRAIALQYLFPIFRAGTSHVVKFRPVGVEKPVHKIPPDLDERADQGVALNRSAR
jgi:hypothetical protein